MGRVVVTEFISIDGVVEAPGGEPGYKHTNWVSRFDDVGQFEDKYFEVVEAEIHLLGRITYESFAGAWPQGEGPFADKLNRMPKAVASTTLTNPTWANTTVIEGDVVEAVRKLRAETEGVILIAGSRTLVATLREAGLIDEYRLMIFPIVLGSGERLFGPSEDAVEMQLVSTKTYANGIVNLVYRPTSAVPA